MVFINNKEKSVTERSILSFNLTISCILVRRDYYVLNSKIAAHFIDSLGYQIWPSVCDDIGWNSVCLSEVCTGIRRHIICDSRYSVRIWPFGKSINVFHNIFITWKNPSKGPRTSQCTLSKGIQVLAYVAGVPGGSHCGFFSVGSFGAVLNVLNRNRQSYFNIIDYFLKFWKF